MVVRAELAPSASSNSNSFRATRPALARSSISSSSSRATTPLRAFSAGAADADALLGGGGGGGNSSNGGGGSAKPRPTDEAGDDDDDETGEETYLDAAAAAAAAASKGITLPADFLAAAASPGGLRASTLAAYAALLGAGSPLSPVARALAAALPFVRDRLLRDPRYLFKVAAEVAIDAGCATVAEVRKRGDGFWDEFEFYLSDLVVGCVLDVVLVTLMAPAMPIGKGSKVLAASSRSLAAKIVAPIRKAASKVPSAVLEASVPGARPYSLAQRTGCLFVKFGEYSLAGMGCGLIGQSVANGLMAAKREFSERRAAAAAKEEGKGEKKPAAIVHLTPPPVGMTALTWGLFMGVSSNVRYQIVYGLERAVDMTVSFFFRVFSFFFLFRFSQGCQRKYLTFSSSKKNFLINRSPRSCPPRPTSPRSRSGSRTTSSEGRTSSTWRGGPGFSKEIRKEGERERERVLRFWFFRDFFPNYSGFNRQGSHCNAGIPLPFHINTSISTLVERVEARRKRRARGHGRRRHQRRRRGRQEVGDRRVVRSCRCC